MYALYCSAAAHLARVLSAFPVHQHVLVTGVWPRFQRALPEAAGGVVVLPWLSDALFPRLCALAARQARAWRPVVLVTTRDADNARHLKDVTVGEVVWLHEVERELWPAVQRAASQASLHDVAALVEGLTSMPPTLREALGYACRSRTPVRSVTALAQATNCRRSTLWYHWRRAVRADASLRLEDFLDWLLVLHALGRKGPDRAWPKVAEELGVHERTLGRLARRLTGLPLQDLNLGGPAAAMELFRERMLHPLIREHDETFCTKIGHFAVAEE